MTDEQNPMFLRERSESSVVFRPFHDFVKLPDPELSIGCS